MIRTTHNDQMSANGAPKGAGDAYDRWQAPVRLNSVGERDLPVTRRAVRSVRPFPFTHPGTGATLPSTEAGGRQLVAFPQRSLSPIHSDDPKRRLRVPSLASQAVSGARSNSCGIDQPRRQALADLSPFVQGTSPLANELSELWRPKSWNSQPRTAT
jgi:hypothetical protein